MIEIDEQDDLDVSAMLARFPHLAADKDAVLKLALADYEARRERGEKPGPRSFASRYPPCRTKLANLLFARQEAEGNGALDSLPAALAEAASQSPWPEAGDRILGFTLLEELGRGGFSRVYLARETDVGDRLVALKVSLEGKDRPDAAAEAEILGRLPHPNIVPIYSVRQDPLRGFTIVCMPYLGDTTLADVLDFVNAPPAQPEQAWIILDAVRRRAGQEAAAGAQPSPIFRHGSYIDGVLEIGIQLADALAFVHGHNVFHRDLKHSNVLVCADGRPMLLDFNLSAAAHGRAAKQIFGGTLLYMSPEQLRAASQVSDPRPCLLDARADLYSLGVMLYELLAGDHPFVPCADPEQELRQGRLLELLSARQEQGPWPIRGLNPHLDKHLASVIEKCLQPKPGDRFQNAAELSGALRTCLEPEYRARRWLRRRGRRTLAAACLSLVATVLLGAAAAALLPGNGRPLEWGIRALQAGQYERATEVLGKAVAQENSFRGHMARGRAYQKLGKFKEALDDFRLADKLQPSGHTKACMAYCFSLLESPLHNAAIASYRTALKRGCTTPAIYNNFGVSMFLFSRASDLEAKRCFRQATALDPSFQLPYYNFFKVELDMACDVNSKGKITREGVKNLESAFATGLATGEMHADATQFFLLAQEVEPCWKDRALHHFQQAISLGKRPVFSVVDNDPQFRQVLRETRLGEDSGPMSRVRDPFLSIDE